MVSSIVLWALLGAAGQASERVLDLNRNIPDETKLRVAQPFSYEGSCKGQGTGRVLPAPPFTLTIQGLNSTEFAMGGQLVADLRVTNTGSEAVAFPWVLRHEFGDGFEGRNAVQVAIGFSMIEASGREQTLTGTLVRGSLDRAGTTRTIAPGESIRIRFPGWIPIIDSPDGPVTGNAQLFASVIYSDGECRIWQQVNSQPVSVRFRSRH